MDINNPIIKLCAEGMKFEREGKIGEAKELFQKAWDLHRDDYEACISAHYMARHNNPEDMFRWNKLALDKADVVEYGLVRAFYPSLYLNMGLSYEDLGNLKEAKRYLDLAFKKINDLPSDNYGAGVKETIMEALNRFSKT